MNYRSRSFRRRWTLPLAAVLLLHWTLGICAASADVLCLEPDGIVAVEFSGKPCHNDGASAASKHCVDMQAGDAHDGHTPLPAHQLSAADTAPVFFVPALSYVLPVLQLAHVALPQATGPPVAPTSLILRETAVLLI
jgi:hypothetical protein